jgi:hypothetical protein
MATLHSEIILCRNIKLDKNYINVLSYSTEQMLDLCRRNAIATASDYSFIRQHNNNIFTGFTYEQCLQANYIAFQNKDYSNKWFFAFIDEVNYSGEMNTEIRYTIDAWSTFFDDWQKQPCYITRQHVNDDSIGANLIDENLNVGEVEAINVVKDDSLDNTYGYYIVVGSTWDIGDNSNPSKQIVGSSLYNGLISAEKLFVIPASLGSTIVDAVKNLQLFIFQSAEDGHLADIRNVYIVPNFCISPADLQLHEKTTGEYTCTYYTLNNGVDIPSSKLQATCTTNYRGYKPKNNKCFIYPYHYLFVTNNNGNNNIYKYENFSNFFSPEFQINLIMMPGCSGRVIPQNYKGISDNIDESLPLAKYPICEWNCDAYINWLSANAVNIPNQIIGFTNNLSSQFQNGGIDSTAGSIASNIINVAGNIANIIGQFYSASLLPSIQGGNNTGDVNFVSNANNVLIYEYKVKDQFLKVIDDYFTRFGYKINDITMPNIIGRRNWNYIEIPSSESIGYGTVPSQYMEEINNACRKGVTIWHNHDNLGNFNLDNSIV